MSGVTLLFFLLFGAFYVMRIITFVLEVMRLVDMYRFYTYLLKIPDVSTSNASLCRVSNDVLFRLIFKPYPGPRLSGALRPSVRRTQSRLCPQQRMGIRRLQ